MGTQTFICDFETKPRGNTDSERETNTLALIGLRQKYKGDFYAQNERGELINEKGELAFWVWDSLKLVGYWYNENKKLLDDLARYCEGFVLLQTERNAEFTKLVFKGGFWYIQENEPISWGVSEWFDKTEKEWYISKETPTEHDLKGGNL